jgi:pilus assembly protein Flp/PilA
LKTLVSHFEKDGSGATAIEYALIAAGIAGAIFAVVIGVGTELQTTFGGISSAMDASADIGSSESSSDSGASDAGASDAGASGAGPDRHHRRASDRHSFEHDHDGFHP